MNTLNITTETVLSKEIKMVEIPQPIQPVRKIRADQYLNQLKTQQTNLTLQLDKIATQIAELEEAGIELPIKIIK